MINPTRCNLAKRFADFISDKLLAPFTCDMPYCMLIWTIMFFPDVIIRLANLQIGYAISIAMMYYVIACAVVVVLNLNRWLGAVLKPAFYTVLVLFTALNIYCIIMYKDRLTHDIVQIVAATNYAEVREYIAMYFSWRMAALLTLYLSVSFVVYFAVLKIKVKRIRALWIPQVVFLSASVILVSCCSDVRREFYGWQLHIDDMVDLCNYKTCPDIEYADGHLPPENVVIIIGESFTPRHSSLYGYEKTTNPLLQERCDSGSLNLFYNVTSTSTHTLNTFKYLLNTHTPDMDDTTQWYKSTTLIEVLKTAGYHTAWFSNQIRTGRWDNIPSAHSKLCDESVFINDGMDAPLYDGELLECMPPAARGGGYNSVFYHLMGQHIVFGHRYPKQYDIFKPDDYADTAKGPEQRLTLAQYDNATLYNDYIVNSIIGKYDDTDAVIFYFSDHGLDIYDTDPDYCGHAIAAIPESVSLCLEVPFMIYLSPKYREARPEIAERIRNSAGNEFRLDKLIYAVMDCVGIKFSGNDDVARYSILGNSDKI